MITRQGINIYLIRLLITMLIGSAVFSCEETKTEDDIDDIPAWGVNESGYPIVVGEYSFITEKIPYVCSDGYSDEVNAFAQNMVVQQLRNELTIFNPDTTSTSDVVIVESTGLKGTLNKEGEFLASNNVLAQFEGIEGSVRIYHHLDGQFTPNTWHGEYSYTMTFLSYDVYCEYETTFEGDKIQVALEKALMTRGLDIRNPIHYVLETLLTAEFKQ